MSKFELLFILFVIFVFSIFSFSAGIAYATSFQDIWIELEDQVRML